MAERTARLYCEEGTPAMIRMMRDLFSRVGVSLANPVSERIYLLDAEGAQVTICETDLWALLPVQDETQFQWWVSANQDIYCRTRRVANMAIVELGLEGLTPSERGLVADVLWECFRVRNLHCIGMVFDSDGALEDYDWDRFFLGGAVLDLNQFNSRFPAILVIDACRESQVANLPPHVTRAKKNGSVAFWQTTPPRLSS